MISRAGIRNQGSGSREKYKGSRNFEDLNKNSGSGIKSFGKTKTSKTRSQVKKYIACDPENTYIINAVKLRTKRHGCFNTRYHMVTSGVSRGGALGAHAPPLHGFKEHYFI